MDIIHNATQYNNKKCQTQNSVSLMLSVALFIVILSIIFTSVVMLKVAASFEIIQKHFGAKFKFPILIHFFSIPAKGRAIGFCFETD
jgi:hypothetical protein